jgi:hypothetical protein
MWLNYHGKKMLSTKKKLVLKIGEKWTPCNKKKQGKEITPQLYKWITQITSSMKLLHYDMLKQRWTNWLNYKTLFNEDYGWSRIRTF